MLTVVSDFKTCFTLPWNQVMGQIQSKFMKVCEKPFSVIGWPWEEQCFRVCNSDNSWCRSLHWHCQWNPEPLVPVSFGAGVGYHVPGDPPLGTLLQVPLEHPTAVPNSPSWCSKGILISLPVQWNQLDINYCHWLLQDHIWVALGYRRPEYETCVVKLLPPGKFWQPMFCCLLTISCFWDWDELQTWW